MSNWLMLIIRSPNSCQRAAALALRRPAGLRRPWRARESIDFSPLCLGALLVRLKWGTGRTDRPGSSSAV
jgi:hypothetical protein